MKNLIILLLILTTLTGIYAQDENENDTPVLLVIDIEGEASLMYRSGATSTLSVGAILSQGEVVAPHGASTVRVLCPSIDEQILVDVITQTRAPNCRADSPTVWIYRDREIVGFSHRNLAGGNPILSIITPRNTQLLYGNPQFSWTPVPNASQYRVSVKLTDGTLIWEKTVTGATSLDYPSDQYNLRAMNDAGQPLEYIIQIRPYDHSGNQIPTTVDTLNDGVVMVATPNERTQIEQRLGAFEQVATAHNVSPELIAYLKAFYLYTEGYYADALQLLYPNMLFPLDQPITIESVSRDQIDQSPNFYKLLGDIFSDSKLRDPAFQAYNHALWLAEQTQDLYGKAEILLKLTMFGGTQAIQHYQDALAIYQQLGNEERITDIESKLAGFHQ